MTKLFIGKKKYTSETGLQLGSPVVSSQKRLFNSGNIQF